MNYYLQCQQPRLPEKRRAHHGTGPAHIQDVHTQLYRSVLCSIFTESLQVRALLYSYYAP